MSPGSKVIVYSLMAFPELNPLSYIPLQVPPNLPLVRSSYAMVSLSNVMREHEQPAQKTATVQKASLWEESSGPSR